MSAPERIWINLQSPWDGTVNPKYGTGELSEYVSRTEADAMVRAAKEQMRERCAKQLEARIDTIVGEEGSWEPDTNVTNLPEWAETATEELETQAAAIRALPLEDGK